MEVVPLGPGFGAEIRGVGLLDVASSAAAYGEVRQAFEAHSVLLFRDQTVTDDVQAAYSRAFGPLEIVKIGSVGTGTFYSRLNNLKDDGTIAPPTHRQVLRARANQLWHTDSSFKQTPALASVLSARTLPHPCMVVPDLRCRIGNDGRCGRRQLGRTRQRVGFERQSPTVRARDGKLVARAVSEPWNEQLPDTSREAQTHRVSPRIPRVEITNDGDSARIRCPDGKPHTLNAIDCHDAGAKVRRQFKMPPFVEQVQIDFAHDRAVLIRIAHGVFRSVPIGDLQPIIEIASRVRNFRLKKPVAMNFLRLDRRLPVLDDIDLARVGTKGANRQIVSHPVRSENAERIGMRAGEENIQFVDGQAGYFEGTHARISNLERAATMSCADFLSSVAASLCEAWEAASLEVGVAHRATATEGDFVWPCHDCGLISAS